jgi:hypothetical protein
MENAYTLTHSRNGHDFEVRAELMRLEEELVVSARIDGELAYLRKEEGNADPFKAMKAALKKAIAEAA